MRVSPPHQQTGIRPRRILFQFDEYLDAKSASQAVFISPVQQNSPDIWIKNRRLHIRLRDSLLPGTTYVISLNSQLKDFHEGTPIAQPYTYAFSTGSQIDTGYVAGHITNAHTGQAAGGYLALLYPADSVVEGSTAEYQRIRPLYASQAGPDGSFRLGYIRPGRYRLLAVQDGDNSNSYSLGTESIAVLADNLFVLSADTTAWHAELTAFAPDEQGPQVVTVVPASTTALRLTLNEPLSQVQAIRTAGGASLPFRLDPKTPTQLLVGAHWQQAADSLLLSLIGLTDTAGNRTDSLLTLEIAPDWRLPGRRQLRPSIQPGPDPYTYELQLPGLPDSLAYQQLSVSGGDTLASGSWALWDLSQPLGPRLMLDKYYPDTLWITLPQDSLWRDSARVLPLVMTKPEALARLQLPVATAAPAVLELWQGAVRMGARIALPAGTDTLLVWPYLPAQPVQVHIIHDRDGNGLWTPGRLHPYRAPEGYYRWPEQIGLRPGWEITAPKLIYPPRQ
jgi:hypothetical protein